MKKPINTNELILQQKKNSLGNSPPNKKKKENQEKRVVKFDDSAIDYKQEQDQIREKMKNFDKNQLGKLLFEFRQDQSQEHYFDFSGHNDTSKVGVDVILKLKQDLQKETPKVKALNYSRIWVVSILVLLFTSVVTFCILAFLLRDNLPIFIGALAIFFVPQIIVILGLLCYVFSLKRTYSNKLSAISKDLEDKWNTGTTTTAQGTICYRVDSRLNTIRLYEYKGNEEGKEEKGDKSKKDLQVEEFSDYSDDEKKPEDRKDSLKVQAEHKRKLSEVEELDEEQMKSHVIIMQDEEFNKSSFLSSNGKASSRESVGNFTNYSCANERNEVEAKIKSIAFPNTSISAFKKYSNNNR